MIRIKGYKEEEVEIKINKNEMLKVLKENKEIYFCDIIQPLRIKFIKSCEPRAEFVDEGKYLAYWKEYYHGSQIKNHIRELTEEELEIYAAINKIMLYVD